MYGRKPSARHWGVFGCDAFVHIPKEQRGALDAKVEPCVYLGHDARQNCASVLVLRTSKVVASRDVLYRHDSFKHARALAAGEQAVGDVVAMDYAEVHVPLASSERDDVDEAAPQGGWSSVALRRARGGTASGHGT